MMLCVWSTEWWSIYKNTYLLLLILIKMSIPYALVQWVSSELSFDKDFVYWKTCKWSLWQKVKTQMKCHKSRAYPRSEFVVANTLAKWKKLEPNEFITRQGFRHKVVSRSCFIFNSLPARGVFFCLLITFAKSSDPDQARTAHEFTTGFITVTSFMHTWNRCVFIDWAFSSHYHWASVSSSPSYIHHIFTCLLPECCNHKMFSSDHSINYILIWWLYELWHVIFQQCGIFTSVDSDAPVQPPFKSRNSKWCSISSLSVIEYSSDKHRIWSDCAYAQADLRFCWSQKPHCWKSHALAHITFCRILILSYWIDFDIIILFNFVFSERQN